MASEASIAQNRLLASLPPEAFAMLQPFLRRVALGRGDVLQEPNRPIERVHFIEDGVAVLLAHTICDGLVEVGIIGRLGLVGVSVVLGTMRCPHRCRVQVQGHALAVDSQDLRRIMDECPPIRNQLMSYVQALLVQNCQTILCNSRHKLEERLARWLLLADDRLDGHSIPLTHALFSMMLGVRRAGITTALQRLERSGALKRGRGCVEIVDRTLLDQRACECYRMIAAEYRRLVAGPRFKHTVPVGATRVLTEPHPLSLTHEHQHAASPDAT